MVAEMLDIFLGVCFPIVAVAAIGWFVDRRIGFDLKSLVRLNIYLFIPCFIFVRLVSVDLPAGGSPLSIVGFSLIVIACMGGLSHVYGRLAGLGDARTRASMLSTMFYNSGNYGLPLVILAFGATAQNVQVFVLATMNVTTFSVGAWIASRPSQGHTSQQKGSWLASLKPLLKLPPLYGITLAMIVRATEIPIQKVTPIWQPLSIVADGLVPIALVTLGVQLSKTKWHGSLPRGLLVVTVIRLLVGPVIGFFLIRLFGFEGLTAAALLVGTSVPSAVNAALIAEQFDADGDFATSVVMASTLLSLVTVTATIYAARVLYL